MDCEALSGTPSARTVARLMTIGRDDLSKSQTVKVAAIEGGVPQLVEAREVVVAFQAMIRKKSLANLEPWLARARSSLVAAFANGVAKDEQPSVLRSVRPGQMDRQRSRLPSSSL